MAPRPRGREGVALGRVAQQIRKQRDHFLPRNGSGAARRAAG